jgi:PEP-CTERM putative exosortase interaction domain
MKIKFYAFILAIVICLSLTAAQDASAGVIFFGDGALGDFDGSLSYSASSASSATLALTLKNTSAIANGGYLTAFVFNNPGNYISGVNLSATDAHFGLLGASGFNNGINAAPYGDFDIGASLSNRFLGGGNASDGIAVGVTETFTFTFTGSNLNTLNEDSFISERSPGSENVSFVARYRGFEDDGSDKVLGETPSTPEPATMSLIGLGLAGLLKIRRKK